MKLNESEIVHGSGKVLLKPEIYDPLRPNTGTDRARIDVRCSEGVLINSEGIVEDAPVITAPKTGNGYDDGAVIEGMSGDVDLLRPVLPSVEWALIRTAVAPYQATALNLPATQLTVEVPEDELSQVSAYFGIQTSSEVSNMASGSSGTEAVLSATSETAVKLREGCERILKEYREVCRRNGAFCSPFLVVAALRMNDGSHTLASAPVLMQPVSAAPLLCIDNAVMSDGCLHLVLSIISVPCRLVMRIAEALSDELTRQLATHLDIFVSEQAPWQTTAYSLRAPVLRTSADIFTHSGLSVDYGSLNRPQQLMSAGDTVPCLYYPRPDREDFGEWLCGVSRFYKAGEVPLDSLSGDRTEVFCGEIPSADKAESFSPDYTLRTEVTGGKVERVNGLTCVVAPQLRLPHTGAIRTLIQYDDRNSAADTFPGSVMVAGSKNGVPVERRCEADAENEILWRAGREVVDGLVWIFYPDPDMRRLTVCIGNSKITLKLRRHRALAGSYWCGLLKGTDRDKENGLAGESEPVENAESVYELPGSMLTALEACGGLFPASRILSFPAPTKLVGIAPALRSMSSGELGRFPLYAFTDSAVWAVSPTDSGGWRQVQPIALTGCDSSSTITATHTAVAFASYGSLWLAEGSKVRRILPSGVLSGEITAVSFDARHNRLMIALDDRRVVLYCMERSALTGVAARSKESPRCFVTMPVRLPAAVCVTAVCCRGIDIGHTRLLAGNRITEYIAGAPGGSLRHFSTSPVSLLCVEVASV